MDGENYTGSPLLGAHMDKRLHILVIPSWFPTPELPLRGSFFLEHAQALVDHGMRVGVIYPDMRSLRTLWNRPWTNYFQIESVNLDHRISVLRQRVWNPPSQYLQKALFVHSTQVLAAEYVKRFGKPDVIHAQSAMWGGSAALEVGQAMNLPFVVTEHSSVFMRNLLRPSWAPSLKKIFSKANGIVAVSHALSSALAPFVGQREVHIIPNGVDTKFFAPSDFNSPKDEPFRPFRFISVAHLTSNKGMGGLIEAFGMAFKGDSLTHLDIAGDGPELPKLRKLAISLGVAGQVRFLGALDRQGVREAMRQADAFVLASHAETFGVVFIEAMASDLPVIGTACGGPSDFITKETGWLVPVLDVSSLRKAMTQARHQTRSIGARSIRDYAEKYFGSQVIAAKYLQIYESAVDGYERAPGGSEPSFDLRGGQ